MYERHKKERNVLVAHCYGSIHTLRLMKWLREQGREGEVKGMVLISLGASALSVGVVSKLPAFFLGESVQLACRLLTKHSFFPSFLFTCRVGPPLGPGFFQCHHFHPQN